MILRLDQWEEWGIAIGPLIAGISPVAHALLHTEERIVLDLHVGDAFERDHRWIDMPAELVLRPSDSVRLRTRERMTTPKSVFGLLCSRSSLAAQGLYVSNIKVDPNFTGPLEVAVFNGGRDAIRITNETAFTSLFFATLETPLTEDVRRTPTSTAGIAFTSWREDLRVATPFVITGAATLAAAAVAEVLLEIVR